MTKKSDVTLGDVYKLLTEFRNEVRDTYVCKAEFEPVRAITYGLVGIILITIVGLILNLVLKTNVSAY